MSENIKALRHLGEITPGKLGWVSEPEHLLPLFDLMSEISGEFDIAGDKMFVDTLNVLRGDKDRKSPEYALAYASSLRLIKGDKTILSRLQGPLDPVLLAQLTVGISDISRQQLSRMSALGTEATLLPSQREFLYRKTIEDLQGMAGIEPELRRSTAKWRLNDFTVRAITHPMKARAGYVDLLLNSAGMDAPTASLLLSSAVQKVLGTSEIMKMLTGSTETLPKTEGTLPTGEQLEAIATAMDTKVEILLKNGTTKSISIEIGVSKCMDFFFGNFGEARKHNGLSSGEPLYISSSRTTPFRLSQLSPFDRSAALSDGTLQPVLTYSPFEPKSAFLASENEYSDMPAEKALTMPAFEWTDVGSRDWVEFLIAESGIDPAQIQAIDIDIPVGPQGPNVRAEASDMQILTLGHPRVKGKEADLTALQLTDAEREREVGRYMLYEAFAARFSEIKKVAMAMFDVGNESVLFDPAQTKGEVPDVLTKALGNIAYTDKYQLMQMDLRQLTLAMYAPATGQKKEYWPLVKALGDKPDRHLRFRDPLGIGDWPKGWPELLAIRLSNGNNLLSNQRNLIVDVFFGRRRHRNDIVSDYQEANLLVKSALAGASRDELLVMAKNVRLGRVQGFDTRSPVHIPRSRQDMYAILSRMSREEREAIRDVDFKVYLESMGYSNMGLSPEEYRGWFGLLKTVEIHSFRQFDWGDAHKLIAKQIKYLTDAGKNFYALMGLAKEMVNSLTGAWQQIVGVNIERYVQGGRFFKPDEAAEGIIKAIAEEIAMHVRTSADAGDYFKKVIEAMSQVADINFQGTVDQRAILKTTIELVDTLIGAFESTTHYDELKSGEGEGEGEPGTKRKLLDINLSTAQGMRAMEALRAAGFRVVVPGNYFPAHVVSGDGTPTYSLKGKWNATRRRWEPERGLKTPLAIFRHLGKEAALTAVVLMFMQDQGYATVDDARDVIEKIGHNRR